jgi:cellulose synthase/poly-beta-1,6-N-acetylglucosamine synthase-like glycosyltransferase
VQVISTVIGFFNWVMTLWLVLIILYQLYISIFGFKKTTKDYRDHDPKLKYLVLVPAHNEEAVIAGIIENLQAMDYPKELYDFYILADNCEDRTAPIARAMGANVLETFKESADAPTGKPIVLQKALNALEGYHNQYDLVMFFDADNRIDTNLFREVNSQLLDHPEADIVQCYLGCKNKKGLVALYYYMSYTITNRFFQYAKSRIGINSVIGGTGFAVRSDYLQKRGGWTAMSLTEDFELQVEATCEGKRILWNNNVRIYDEKPTRWRASLRQRIRWAQGHWFVCFKNTPPHPAGAAGKAHRFRRVFKHFPVRVQPDALYRDDDPVCVQPPVADHPLVGAFVRGGRDHHLLGLVHRQLPQPAHLPVLVHLPLLRGGLAGQP